MRFSWFELWVYTGNSGSAEMLRASLVQQLWAHRKNKARNPSLDSALGIG